MAEKITAPGLRARKATGERIVCVTAYDATFASIADAAGVDVVLVGDSIGNVVYGYSTTLPVSLEQMELATSAVREGAKKALVVADMPFGSYQASVSDAVNSAVRLMKSGAEAVKLEGDFPEAIAAIVRAGIPVMGHLGMTPQSVNAFGGFRVQAKEEDGVAELLEAAASVEAAGAFAYVLELVPAPVAARVTEASGIPTIGIGAGVGCTGQVQVLHDVLGLGPRAMRHAKQYVAGRRIFQEALEAYAKEVREGSFPTEAQSF